MIANLRLGTKFTLFLSIVFIGGMVVGGVALWQALEQKTQNEATSRGLILIELMRSVRGYTDTHIKPLLENDLETSSSFVRETVPSFSATTVFEQFRKVEGNFSYSYKEASLNPTNRENKADSFEADLLQRFHRERELEQISGFRTFDDKRYFYIARPLVVNSQSCLSCHSDSALAPKSLISTYGAEHGFGWRLNDIIATQVIYVPADEIFNAAMWSFLLVMGIFSSIFVVVIFLINLLLRRYVIQPVSVMGSLAQQIRNDEMTAEDLESESILKVTERTDELGHLSRVFRDMAYEISIRTQDLKQQVQELRIEVNVRKRQEDVADIVESDFFKDVQSKARAIRKRHREDPKRTLLLPRSEPEDDSRRTLLLPRLPE
jgi:methyl-accepting chemotaxis protein